MSNTLKTPPFSAQPSLVAKQKKDGVLAYWKALRNAKWRQSTTMVRKEKNWWSRSPIILWVDYKKTSNQATPSSAASSPVLPVRMVCRTFYTAALIPADLIFYITGKNVPGI